MTSSTAVSPVQAARPSGKHDPAARRGAQRTGRERGCWVYLTGQDLERAGYAAGEPAPFYRVWGGERGRYVVTLYRQP